MGERLSIDLPTDSPGIGSRFMRKSKVSGDSRERDPNRFIGNVSEDKIHAILLVELQVNRNRNRSWETIFGFTPKFIRKDPNAVALFFNRIVPGLN